MSFDMFLFCVQDGEPSTFPLALVEEAFGLYAKSRNENGWQLHFPDGGVCDLYFDPTPQTDGFMVSRPSGNPELWKGLIEILKRTTSVLLWPGGPPVIADVSVIPHIPRGMIESLGEPVITTDSDKIRELIRNS